MVVHKDTKTASTDAPKAKALPSAKVLRERIERNEKKLAEDKALLAEIEAKRQARSAGKLSSIEEQIAKLQAARDALVGVTPDEPVLPEA